MTQVKIICTRNPILYTGEQKQRCGPVFAESLMLHSPTSRKNFGDGGNIALLKFY